MVEAPTKKIILTNLSSASEFIKIKMGEKYRRRKQCVAVL